MSTLYLIRTHADGTKTLGLPDPITEEAAAPLIAADSELSTLTEEQCAVGWRPKVTAVLRPGRRR